MQDGHFLPPDLSVLPDPDVTPIGAMTFDIESCRVIRDGS